MIVTKGVQKSMENEITQLVFIPRLRPSDVNFTDGSEIKGDDVGRPIFSEKSLIEILKTTITRDHDVGFGKTRPLPTRCGEDKPADLLPRQTLSPGSVENRNLHDRAILSDRNRFLVFDPGMENPVQNRQKCGLDLFEIMPVDGAFVQLTFVEFFVEIIL